MSNGNFNIINYIAGLTGYAFDTDVLNRIALDCGVMDITEYSQITEEQKDKCKIALLETLLFSPSQSASQTDRHGDWQTQIGSQTISASLLDSARAELKRLYKKYDQQDKIESLNDVGAGLCWINEND